MSKLILILGLFCMLAVAIANPVPEENADAGHEDGDERPTKDADNLEPFIRPVDFMKYKDDPCTEEALDAFVGRFEDVYKHIDDIEDEERISQLLDPVSLGGERCANEFDKRVQEVIDSIDGDGDDEFEDDDGDEEEQQ